MYNPTLTKKANEVKEKSRSYLLWIIIGSAVTVGINSLFPESFIGNLFTVLLALGVLFILGYGLFQVSNLKNIEHAKKVRQENLERKENARLIRQKVWEHEYNDRLAKKALKRKAVAKYGHPMVFPFHFSFEKPVYDYSQPWSAKYREKQDKRLAKQAANSSPKVGS